MKKEQRPVFAEAVQRYWQIRTQQAKEQKERGVTDTGTKSDVVGGKQMDGFSDKIITLLETTGLNASDIHTSKNQLPGYYRPHKGWDLIVVKNHKLLAAIEFKSQVGPSFGNNFNNRVEEALGSAEDFWTAYREGAFGTSPRPWLGYLFFLEDCPDTHKERRLNQPHFKALDDFKKTSYAKRYEILLRKLVHERKYDSACLMLSDSSKYQDHINYSEPASDLSSEQFIKQLLSHIKEKLS